MRKVLKFVCLAGVFVSLLSVPVYADLGSSQYDGLQSTESIYFKKENSEVEQASRAVGFIKSAIQMPENRKYSSLFHSICDEGGTYQGLIGKAILFHTGKKTAFYKILETNTYAYPVTFQIYNVDSVGLDQAGMKNQVAADSLAEPTVKLESDTDYYIVMYSQNRKSMETGEVGVSILELEDDYPDQMAQAKAVGFNRQIQGRLEGYSDKDYFSICTDNKKAYHRLFLQNKSIKRLAVSVYDKNGILLESPWSVAEAATKESNLELEPLTVYYICISGSEDTYLGAYSFQVGREYDEAGDTVPDAVKIRMDSSFSGKIQAENDVDMISFNCGNASVCEVDIKNQSDSQSLKYRIITTEGKMLKNGSLEAGLSAKEQLRDLQKNANLYVQISGKAGAFYEVGARFVRHKITYCLDNGKNNKKNLDNFIETKKLKLYPAKRRGYLFCGWYRDKKMTEKIEAVCDLEKNPIKLYAKWEKVQTERTRIKSVKRKGKSMKLSYERINHAKGYQISYAFAKNFHKAKIVMASGTQRKISGIKKGKPYFIKVRAYKRDSAGKNVYGKWSKVFRLSA